MQDIQIPCRVEPAEISNGFAAVVRGRFEDEHRRRYGFELDAPIEIATVRVVGSGQASEDRATETPQQSSQPAQADHEDQVFFDGEWHSTAIYQRDTLQPGHSVPGPAVIVQQDTTTVIEPGYGGEIDGYGNIIIRKLEGNHR
jgi:N-methylhydantoinase A